MLVIPSVDIRKGKCVQWVGGEPETGRKYGDPVQAALKWEGEGAMCLHVVDLDAAMGEGENLDKVAEILANVATDVQVGGGIRTVDRGFELLGIGASRVILGTVAYEDPDILRELVEKSGSERVMVAMDVKEGQIVIRGWKEKVEADFLETAKKFEAMGVGGFMFTNVDVEGKMAGVDPEAIEELVSAVEPPVIASGGVESLRDVERAKEAGASGLVVGTALYEGKISFREAMEVAE